MMRAAHLTAPFAFLAMIVAPASASAAHTRDACLDSAVVAQRLLKARKLHEAHASLVTCASEECPRVVRRDCAQWLAEAEAAQPTVVLAVRDAKDHDVTDARVTIDDQPMPDALGGRAIPLDPGMHALKIEREGTSAVTEKVVVREAEKARSIVIKLPLRPGEDWATVPSASSTSSTSSTAAQDEVRAPVSPVTYVLAGIGVVGLGTFAVMGLQGLSTRNSMCSDGTCPSSAFDQVRTQYIVADIGLGIGAVSLALAAWTFFTRGHVSAETRTASSRPRR